MHMKLQLVLDVQQHIIHFRSLEFTSHKELSYHIIITYQHQLISLTAFAKYKKRDRTRCYHNTTSAFLRNANCSSSDPFASNPGRCAVQKTW